MSTTEFTYDVASALWQGARPYQEDNLQTGFEGGASSGFSVLADGMGGAAAGGLASELVVVDAFERLKGLMDDPEGLEARLHQELRGAIETANQVIADRGAEDISVRGMGATFLATVLFGNRLYWASVGDSPLFLFRNGELHQINEDHSLAPVIDQMVERGELTAEEA
ncbi:MAG: protein phosphatase 2C domain-containing protein, partial [Pseudomonadota bacterium]